MLIAGIDEAGRGPVIGPLVIAIVAIRPEKERELLNIGVKDSKLLSPVTRGILYNQIVELVDRYEIAVIDANEVDSALKDPNSNLNKLEAKTASNLIVASKADKVYVDCPTTKTYLFKSYLTTYLSKLKYTNVDIISEHKADLNYPVVSAASILAKVTRDSLIEEMKRDYNVDFGSGYTSDPLTQKFINSHWENPKYSKIIRKNWETFKRLKSSKSQTSLKSY